MAAFNSSFHLLELQKLQNIEFLTFLLVCSYRNAFPTPVDFYAEYT